MGLFVRLSDSISFRSVFLFSVLFNFLFDFQFNFVSYQNLFQISANKTGLMNLYLFIGMAADDDLAGHFDDADQDHNRDDYKPCDILHISVMTITDGKIAQST